MAIKPWGCVEASGGWDLCSFLGEGLGEGVSFGKVSAYMQAEGRSILLFILITWMPGKTGV